MAKPDLIDAIAAVTLVLERDYPYYTHREVLGVVDVTEDVDYDYCWIVLARTSENEWQLYTVRPTDDAPAHPGNLEHAANGLVVRSDTNAPSHAHGLLELLGLSTGIT